MAGDTHSVTSAANNALRYWLHGSVSEVRGIPLSDNYLNGKYIRRIPDNGLGDLALEKVGNRITSLEYARKLSGVFSRLDTLVSKEGAKKRVVFGGSYDEWLCRGGAMERYEPVHKLKKIVDQKSSLFQAAVLHGSVATLDDVCGFSDLDTAFFVRVDALKSVSSLIELRQTARRLLTWTYAFDPFMHHGPHYITEIDMRMYRQASKIPLGVFPYSASLGVSESVVIYTVKRKSALKVLGSFRKFFDRVSHEYLPVCNTYKLEWIIGNTLILPVLFLQGKSPFYRYKRDAIPAARSHFTAEQWAPIDTASRLRRELGPRPKPPLSVAQRCSDWGLPALLRSWIYHPRSILRARSAATVLDDSFFDGILALIDTMKAKLKN
jgi:hypothetical protein